MLVSEHCKEQVCGSRMQTYLPIRVVSRALPGLRRLPAILDGSSAQ